MRVLFRDEFDNLTVYDADVVGVEPKGIGQYRLYIEAHGYYTYNCLPHNGIGWTLSDAEEILRRGFIEGCLDLTAYKCTVVQDDADLIYETEEVD